MIKQKTTLEDVKHRSLEEVIQEVWRERRPMTIYLSGEEAVVIQPEFEAGGYTIFSQSYADLMARLAHVQVDRSFSR
ncbi:MAG: hypothetical protein R6X32_19890 [Chloroflexota bacterium]